MIASCMKKHGFDFKSIIADGLNFFKCRGVFLWISAETDNTYNVFESI